MPEVIISWLGILTKLIGLGPKAARLPRRWKQAAGRRNYGKRIAELRRQVGEIDEYLERGNHVSSQKFADRLGFDDLGRVKALEDGEVDPDHADLDRLADGTGANRDHLLDGSGALWTAPTQPISPDPLGALEAFDVEVSEIIAVRVDAPDGHVALILSKGETDWVKLLTFSSFHFGSMVGGGGQGQQYQFFRLRCALAPDSIFSDRFLSDALTLREQYPNLPSRPLLRSHTVSTSAFEQLEAGNIHPYAFLRRYRLPPCHWFVDFADVDSQSAVASQYGDDFGENFLAVQANIRAKIAQSIA